MYHIIPILSALCAVECANYQRYAETTNPYPSYSTGNNVYNQYPYKSGSYGSDVAQYPDATRYPNYNPGYSTNNYNSFNTPGSKLYQQPGYSTQGYDNFGQYGPGYTSYEIPFTKSMKDNCVNRSPQTGIWVDSLMGMWYGVEFIQHMVGDTRVDYARTCIVIHIAEPMDRPSTENQLFHVQHISAKFRQEYRHLRLLWDEAGQTIEYALYFRNDSAGYWQVFEPQNGTLPLRPNYQQFSGTVQVLRAVNDHLVLNFCQEPTTYRPAQSYSVLLSRDPGLMAQWEINAVHNMLQNKNLSVASRRLVCGNSADRPALGIILSIVTTILAYFVASS